MMWLWFLLVTSILCPAVLLSGVVAIYRRDVQRHQYRMLMGSGILLIMLVVSWQGFLHYGSMYEGRFLEAHGLLQWLQLGLGVVSLTGVSLALWCVRERSWALHRRAGMYALLSGVISSLATAALSVMSLVS